MKSASVYALGYVLATGCLQQAAPAAEGDAESVEPVAATSEALNSVPIWADPSGNQTITQGAGTVLTLAGAVRSTGTLNAKVLSGTTMVDQLATAGTGASASPWTGWETALNSLPDGAEIYFPAGYYGQATTIQTRTGWTLRGAGEHASVIVSNPSFAGDAIQSISTYNGSTGARLSVRDLQLVSTSSTPVGAGIDVVAGTFVDIKQVVVLNYKYGAILDQAEVVSIEACELGANITAAAAGLWIVDNADHQNQHVPGVPLSPVPMSKFSNRISVRNTQFNVVAGTGIMDDGGLSHSFEDNNVNGGSIGIRLAGVTDARVTGNLFSWQADYPMLGTSTAVHSGSSSGPNVGVHFANNHVSNTVNAIRLLGGSAISLLNNAVDTSGVAFSGTGSVTDLTAFGNQQLGSGTLYDASPVSGIVSNGGSLGVQTAYPTAELEVNGGMKLFTSKTQPTCSAATRGLFWFSQGGVNVKDSVVVCAKGSANNYLWRVIY